MEALVNAISDIIAAVLARFGYVGRPRRRAAIQDDLVLLHELRNSPAFGSESHAHSYLSRHITAEVARFAGVEIRQKSRRPWTAIALALLIGIPLAYWTYATLDDGFNWYAVPLGIVAGLMFIAVFGMFIEGEPVEEEGGEAQAP